VSDGYLELMREVAFKVTKYYDYDADHLIELEPRVQHCEVYDRFGELALAGNEGARGSFYS
jgi:hypothetical protein